jgi:hypothetical protein
MQETTTMSNEVLLAAIGVFQVFSVAMSKVIDYFVEHGKADALESKIDRLLESDGKRMEVIQRMASTKADDARILADLYQMHKVTDDEGRPAWYFPKKMLELSEDHLELLRDVAMAQKEAALTMKSIVDKLASMGSTR